MFVKDTGNLSLWSRSSRSFLSAASADSEKENKKKKAKKAFEVNFDEDVDFETYFRKTKVCTEFLPLLPLLYQCVLESHQQVAHLGSLVEPGSVNTAAQHPVCSFMQGLLASKLLTVLPTLK